MYVSKLTTRATLLDVGCLFFVLYSSKYYIALHVSYECIRRVNTAGANILLVDKFLKEEIVSS